MTIRFHTSVFEAMRREARRFSVETGGLLIGPDENTVSELIPSGDSAIRSATEYVLDTNHLQPLLDDAYYRGLRFLGIWHVHPKGCHDLSRTDLTTARRMLGDSAYGLDRLLMPLSIRAEGDLETRFFVVAGKPFQARPIFVSTVHDGLPSERVGSDRAGSSAAFSRIGATYDLRARLTRDVAAAESAGWSVSLRICDTAIAVRVSNADLAIVALCPPEYPINPPDFFLETRTGLQAIAHSQIPETLAWSSERSLVCAFEQAAEFLRNGSNARRLVRPSAMRRLVRASAHLVWRKPHVHRTLPFPSRRTP